MNRYAVLGSGLMGRFIARAILAQEASAQILLADLDEGQLARAANPQGGDRLTTVKLDAADAAAVTEFLRGCRVAVSALPHRLSLGIVVAAIEAGVSLVDLVGAAAAERLKLHEIADRRGILVVPGCVVAPGLRNCCVGHACELLEDIHHAHIYVGGLPRRKEPPLYYETVYLLESVLDAYCRKAALVQNGRVRWVDALTGLETMEFPEPIGALEAFYTDGLGSLPITLGEKIRDTMFEKTLRYPGHAERILLLKQCGLLSDTPVLIGASKVVPRDLLAKLLGKRLQLGPAGDILVMRVEVQGTIEGTVLTHTYDLLDYFDPGTGETAMARTTGFPAAQTARLIARGTFPEKGVSFPEQLFTGERFDAMVSALAAEGVKIRHRVNSSPAEHSTRKVPPRS